MAPAAPVNETFADGAYARAMSDPNFNCDFSTKFTEAQKRRKEGKGSLIVPMFSTDAFNQKEQVLYADLEDAAGIKVPPLRLPDDPVQNTNATDYGTPSPQPSVWEAYLDRKALESPAALPDYSMVFASAKKSKQEGRAVPIMPSYGQEYRVESPTPKVDIQPPKSPQAQPQSVQDTPKCLNFFACFGRTSVA